MNKELGYKLVYPKSFLEHQMFYAASKIIEGYAKQGLMLEQSPVKLADMADKRSLVLALDDVTGQVIGTAGFTFAYDEYMYEFGAWAVNPKYQNKGIGLSLLGALLFQGDHFGKKIAFGNSKSGPIFEKLGAKIMDHEELPSAVFIPCKTCNCSGKENFPKGKQCVDNIYDLSTITKKVIEQKLGHTIPEPKHILPIGDKCVVYIKLQDKETS